MDSKISVARYSIFALLALLVLGVSGTTRAATRMYTGSLIIEAFGNDTTTGASAPYDTDFFDGIPLTGNCNTAPYHAQETVTFPTYPTATQTVMFTVPKYGGQVLNVDTNSDTIPDIVAGCGVTSLKEGDPLTGDGSLATTGSTASARTAANPRGFTLPQSALSRVKSDASFNQYGAYLFEVHYADLRNDKGTFGKSLGDGGFGPITHAGERSAEQTAGTNRFGGVMRLLGTYFSNEGYYYNNTVISAAKYTWLFQYLGNGSSVGTSLGVVTAGYIKTDTNRGYTLTSGYPFTSSVSAEVFKWTTGTVKVTAKQGTFPTILERKGTDERTAMGAGMIQMVTPMLTHWTGASESSTAEIGILKITFVPEPGRPLLMLAAGASVLGLMFRSSRKG